MLLLPNRIRNKVGFSLVEIVVVMGMLVFLTVSITKVFTGTFRAFGFSQDRAQATNRISLAFQKMVDELQQSDGIKSCDGLSVTFSLAGSFYKYQVSSNQLQRIDPNNRKEILVNYVKTPGSGGAYSLPWLCSGGTVRIDLTTYNPAFSSTLTTNNTSHFVTTVTPRGIPYGLVYWWKLNEGTDTTLYDLGGRYPSGNMDGIPAYLTGDSGGPAWTTGIANGALTFTASNNDYLYLNEPIGGYGELNGHNSWTVSFWFKATTLKAYASGQSPGMFIASRGAPAGIFISTDNWIYRGADDADNTVATTTSVGCWYHLAMSFDASSGSVMVYKNGDLLGTITHQDSLENSGYYFDTIGTDYTNYFNGVMDDIRFYNYVLSNDEIAKLSRYLPYYSSSALAIADIYTDANNCGAIGTVCAGGTSCYSGKCCTTGYTNCSTTGGLCGTCYSMASSSTNCGNCGNACAGGKSCSDGYCCTTGLTNCFTGVNACQNLTNDSSNCGSCGNACGVGTPTCCSSSCVNTTTNSSNCGSCGNACTSGTTPACCSSSCVDEYVNTSNCGACGTTCGGGTPYCCHGSCSALAPTGTVCTVNGECCSNVCSCFTSGTKVLLINGKKIAIEKLKVGDVLLGSNRTHNKVIRLDVRPKEVRKIYSFNDGRYFVTENHPFMTKEGWKALNPQLAQLEQSQIKIGQLNIGDEIVTQKGFVKLKKIKFKTINTVVYNPQLDGSHDYYADGFLVHNKGAKHCT